ncbi:hypothetical protein HDU92_001338 [Lobulomyces angularis]|nr:hypothetical protein HDU92_001338 [Lobulomyces angularis]
MHALFWGPRRASDIVFLAFYNWIFLYVGITALFISVMSRGQRISWMLPSLSVFEVGCNYFTYCTDFSGINCPKKQLLHENNNISLAIIIFGLSFFVVFTTVIFTMIYKRNYKLGKERIARMQDKVMKNGIIEISSAYNECTILKKKE